MAHQAIPQVDGFGLVARDDSQPEEKGRVQISADETAFALLGNTSSAQASGRSLSDLALDLVLNEIVQQARLATTATGATIRLVREGEVVCRAAAGATAAEIAAYLKLRSAIVGACFQTGHVQRCEDTEADSRLDATSCRRLGLRSILLAPIKDVSQKTLGMIEVFSARARAFSDRDVLTLQALSRRVQANLDLAARIMPPAAADPVAALSRENCLQPEVCVADSSAGLVTRTGTYSARNGIFLLLVAVAASALLVGWTVGRTGRGSAGVRVDMRADGSRAERLAVNSSAIAPNVATSAPVSESVTAIASGAGPSKTGSRAGAAPTNVLQARTSKVNSLGKATPNDSLVVYENRKSAFQQEQSLRSSESTRADSTGAPVPGAPIALAPIPEGSTTDVTGHMVWLPEEIANANVLSRVDPQYPKNAIDQHIQGQVVLDVEVGQTGVVRGVRAISGQTLLVAAATDALQRWRFRPYFVNGKAMNFETHVSVNFALP